MKKSIKIQQKTIRLCFITESNNTQVTIKPFIDLIGEHTLESIQIINSGYNGAGRAIFHRSIKIDDINFDLSIPENQYDKDLKRIDYDKTINADSVLTIDLPPFSNLFIYLNYK